MGFLNYGVFGGSIPLSDLAPQAAETIVANPTGSTASPQAVTVGVENGFIGTELVSTLDFADFASITTGTDATVAVTNFEIAGFINSVVRGAMDKGNLASRCRTKLRCMTGYPLTLTSPLVVTPFTDWDGPLQILRNFPSSGSASAFYNGLPTSNAFNNLAMPTVFLSLYGHAAEIDINASPNSNIGAGIAGPRYWQLLSGGSGATVGVAGSGYTNGDTVTLSIGGLPSPFAAPQFTLTVSGGVVTAVTPVASQLGILPFPPKMMRAAMGDVSGNFITAWTNPITGGPTWATAVAATSTTKATAVYDANGYYITTGGTGTGLTINIPDDTTAWNPDFSGAAATYLFQTAQTDTILGNIKAQGVATTSDATYGPIIGYMLATGEHFINNLVITGGYYGLQSNAIDVAVNAAHITDAYCALKIGSGGDFSCPTMILDSPTNHYAEIDSCEGVILKGRCFTTSGTNIGGSYAFEIGANGSSSAQNRNLDLDFEFDNAGKSTGIPAASIAYIQDSSINFKIGNIESKTGVAATKYISSFAAFGSGVGNNNRITGRIDQVFGAIYSGTLPGCFFDIWDAEVPLQYGSVTATFGGTAANTSGTFTFTNTGIVGWGTAPTVSVTITSGQTVTQMAQDAVTAINAASAVTNVGVHAVIGLAGALTIYQSGSQANNTVVSYTAGSTETVTFSNSGVISGAVSGGQFKTGGTYDLIGNGAPTNGTTLSTGLNKAIANSRYIDATNNIIYQNTGSASSPLWTQTALLTQINGATSVTHSASPYTVLPNDYLLEVDTTGGAVTINLPNPAVLRRIKIKDIKGNFGTNQCTVAQYASENIEGTAGSLVLWANWGNYELQSDGTNWYKTSAACNTAKASFSTHGSYSWVSPNGITNVTVYGRGGSGGAGGGAGGGGGSTAAGAGGGGAGGNGGSCDTVAVPLTVVPATSYSLTVGTAGTGGSNGSGGGANPAGSTGTAGATTATNGTASSFGTLAAWVPGYAGTQGQPGSLASGGTAGTAGGATNGIGTAGTSGAGGNAGSNGTGGSAASSFRGPFSINGSASSGGTGNQGGGGGGAAAYVYGDYTASPPSAGAGGAGGTAGNQGSTPAAAGGNGVAGGGGIGGCGGGGGGVLATTGTAGGNGVAGGNGSDGQIIITWQE